MRKIRKDALPAKIGYREIVALLAMQMSKQTSFADMFNLYLLNQRALKDWTFIVATTEPDNMDLYLGMEGIPGIKERLFTPFANGRVSIINDKILKRCLKKNDSRARIYRSVSFDTQTVSYIERYHKNGSAPYEGFDAVIHLLKGEDTGVDYIPYTLENLMFDLSRKDSVEQTLFAFEMMCGENAGYEKKCKKQAHNVVSLYEKKEFEVPFAAKELYRTIYLALLKMSQIQLEFSEQTADKKLKLFVEFMTTELCRIIPPEINLAQIFFTKGTGCGFFGKIQVGNHNVLDQLKNMTWDLMHLRFLNYSSTMFNSRKGDALIPYFFTYDRKLQGVRECYCLRALAINAKNQSLIPIYVVDDYIQNLLNECGTLEKHNARMQKEPDVEQLIAKYEKNLAKLIIGEKKYPLPN